jgi:hypothetical protein
MLKKSCLELVLASLDISNVWLSSEICFLFHLSLKTPVLWRRDLLTSDISPSGKNPTTKLFFKHLACPSESNFGYNELTSSLRRMPPWPKVVAPTLVTLLSMLASSIGLNLDGKSEKSQKN